MSDAVTRVSVEIEGKEISFETGKLAKQASGAVVVQAGETMVLCTATAGNLRDVDFLPLTVDVEERMYAAGKIPGSFLSARGARGRRRRSPRASSTGRSGRCSPRAGGMRPSSSRCRCRLTTSTRTTSSP